MSSAVYETQLSALWGVAVPGTIGKVIWSQCCGLISLSKDLLHWVWQIDVLNGVYHCITSQKIQHQPVSQEKEFKLDECQH